MFTAIVYSNDVLDTLNLICSGEHTVQCSRIIREIQPESNTELSDFEYDSYIGSMAGPTPSILSEAEQLEQSLLALSDDYDDLPLFENVQFMKCFPTKNYCYNLG